MKSIGQAELPARGPVDEKKPTVESSLPDEHGLGVVRGGNLDMGESPRDDRIVLGPALPARLKRLLRSEDGDTNGMMDYIGAAALFVFIVVVLFLLRRSDQRRNRQS